MTTKTQTRGICQVCGREHAVVRGTMSKHGYRVSEHGWFVGVCIGQHYQAMQIDRSVADATVLSVRKQCDELRVRAAELKDGKIDPLECSTGRYDSAKRATIMIPYAQGTTSQQKQARESAIWQSTQRATMGKSFADQLEGLANTYHGQPLRVVAIEPGPAPILHGDQRTSESGRVLTVTRVEGARVYWKDSKGYKGWTGTQSWRRMAVTEPAAA